MGPGESIGGRFDLEREAGAGGMGTVYRALDRFTGQAVAVKLLHQQGDLDVDLFSREATVLAELSHPAIVRYVAHGTTPAGVAYLAMEWLDGATLRERLSHAPLSVPETVALALRVAQALEVAHQRGVVHRDIKPSNLFAPDGLVGRAKLIDFGIARRHRGGPDRGRAGAMIGTPAYMAPEQARGDEEIDGRADLFALGCVLYECLAGERAFAAEDMMAVRARILIEEPAPLAERRADLPRALDALVVRLLAKDPAARPEGAGVLCAELAALVDDIEGGSAPTPRSAGLGESVLEQTMPATPRERPGKRTAGGGAPTGTDGGGGTDDAAAAGAPQALTRVEQRLFSVVLAGAAESKPGGAENSLRGEDLHRTVEPFGARAESLGEDATVVTLAGRGTAVDQATRAARCALALRSLLPDAPMVLVTGRGVIAGPMPIGEVLDRGVGALKSAVAGAIRLDELTAGLLDNRFELSGDADGLYLLGERDAAEATRTLLGKATRCVGRERELSILEGTFAECASEPVARVVLFTAPAGAGKSRLRQEFLNRLTKRRTDVQVLFGQGDALRAGSPFGTIGGAVRRAAGILEGEPRAVQQRKLRARLARHLSGPSLERVVPFIGELANVRFDDHASVAFRAARQDPMLMGDAIRAAWEQWLGAECAAQPVIVVLDDLQWGDQPSVKLVDGALRNLKDAPLMVLALGRPEVHAQLPGLWAEREVQEIRLGALTRKASEKLVHEVLGGRIDAPSVERLVERADGNAFFLEELIRAHAAASEDQRSTTEGLPPTVLGMVQSRLDALGDEAKRVLRAASVFGETFWRGGVLALLGGESQEGTLSEWLEELIGREVVVQSAGNAFPGQAEYAFRHAFLRDAAYAMLTEGDRTLGHRLAGAWLDAHGDTDATRLAEHYERGQEPARAIGWYRRAAEQALEGNDFSATLERAERGIACGATGELRGQLRLLQAEAHKWRGNPPGAERAAMETVDLVARGSVPWFRAVSEVFLARMRSGRVEEFEAWAEEVGGVGAEPGALSAQVDCLARSAFSLIDAGLEQIAAHMAARVEALVADGATVEPAAMARVHMMRALGALYAGDTGTYVVEHEEAASAIERAGDERTQGLVQVNLGFGYAELGDFGRAERVLREAIARAERMAILHVVTNAQQNLGSVLALCGRFEDAQAVERAALAAGRKIGDVQLEILCHVDLAKIACLAGDLAAAEREARWVIDAPKVNPLFRAGALGYLARALLGQGRAEDALNAAKEALSIVGDKGGAEYESTIRLVLAEALEASGDPAGAKKAIGSARERIEARAARIADERWRASFLANVPDHARTLQLARERSVG